MLVFLYYGRSKNAHGPPDGGPVGGNPSESELYGTNWRPTCEHDTGVQVRLGF